MTNKRLSSLSIIIPAYNDGGTITEVIEEALLEGRKMADDLEILVTDDGSGDKTAEIIAGVARKIKEVKLLKHSQNKGFGKTIRELYQKGQKDFIFSIPGDGQYKASSLAVMAEGITAGADIIIGERRVRSDNIYRRLQSGIYNFLIKHLFKVKIRDVNSSKLIRKKALESINLEYGSAFVDAELIIKANDKGFKVKNAYIDHFPRTEGRAGGARFKTVFPVFVDLVRFFIRRNIFRLF